MNRVAPGRATNRWSPAALGAVVALHALGFWGLLQMKAIALPAMLPVLSVSLLPPAEVIKPDSQIVPPKAKPLERRPAPLRQPLPPAARAETAEQTALAVPPAPTLVAPAPILAAAPAAPTRPRFDADYLDNPKPAYPALARRMKEQGRVVLRVQVGANGLPTDVQLHDGSGSDRLDNAALEAVRRWKFVPARLGSEPVAAAVLVPIVFSLKD